MRTLDWLMYLARQRAAYSWLTDPKSVSQLRVRHSAGGQNTNLGNGGITKSVMRCAFENLVTVIVRACASPKVVGINAMRLVSTRAVVQHPKTFWKRAAVNQPGKFVGSYLRAKFCADDVVIHHPAISSCLPPRGPKPAGIRLFDVLPESLNDGRRKVLLGEVLGRYLNHVLVLRGTAYGACRAFSFSQT